jgi:two-component system, NarL family, sensor kinase
MKQFFALTILAFHILNFSTAQSLQNIDSLESVLKNEKADTNTFKKYIKQMQQLSSKEIEMQKIIGNWIINNTTDQKFKYYNAKANLELGMVYFKASNYPKGAQFITEAQKISKENKFYLIQSDALTGLAHMYFDNGQIEKALSAQKQALDISTINDFYPNIPMCKINLALMGFTAYPGNKDTLYKGISLLFESVKDFEKLKDTTFAINTYNEISNAYIALNKPDSAILILNKVKNFIDISKKEEELLQYYLSMGDNLQIQKKYSLAIENYKNGVLISQKYNQPNFEYKYYFGIANSYKNLGDYKNAFIYQELNKKIQDSVTNTTNFAAATDIQNKYESQKKENEIFKLNTSNKQKSTLNKVFIGSIIGLGLLGFLGYRNFRTKRKLQQAKITELEKNKQLLTIDAMLQGQEEERSRIAKDLHDGLGGMLSGTKLSFMNMKENLIMDAPNISAFENSILQLDNTIAELRKVAHNLMPEALVKFGLKNAVLDYCNALQLSSKTKIVYEQMGEDRALGNTADLYIYRIIQELVNNSIKHANANTILVQLTKTPQKVLVTVEDDGKGFDKNLLSTSKGIGLQSVQQRIDYLKGSLQIDTKPNEGTSFHIELQA